MLRLIPRRSWRLGGPEPPATWCGSSAPKGAMVSNNGCDGATQPVSAATAIAASNTYALSFPPVTLRNVPHRHQRCLIAIRQAGSAVALTAQGPPVLHALGIGDSR